MRLIVGGLYSVTALRAMRLRAGTVSDSPSSEPLLIRVLVKESMGDENKTKKLCPHWKRRSGCRDCGGSAFCEHQRHRSTCKGCGGSALCEHQRERSKGRDCGGSAWRLHQRRRSRCKECGGASICEHQRQRSKGRNCGGEEPVQEMRGK